MNNDKQVFENGENDIDTIEDLEKQGDFAADYLEGFLDIADIDGDIEIEVRNDRPYVSIVSEAEYCDQLNKLVGEKSQVLNALQELTRRAVFAQTGKRTGLILDINQNRKKRLKKLKKITEIAMEKASITKTDVHIEAMTSYERKIAHDIIAASDYKSLISESEGKGAERHIVIKNKI